MSQVGMAAIMASQMYLRGDPFCTADAARLMGVTSLRAKDVLADMVKAGILERTPRAIGGPENHWRKRSTTLFMLSRPWTPEGLSALA